jgi:hypothetical protein
MTNPPYYGPPQPAWGAPPASGPSRVPMVLAFVGIVIAIALGVVALLRPAAQAAAPAEVAPQYSEQQVADARKAVCEAYDRALSAVAGAAKQKSADPNLQFIDVVNARLAFDVSTDYFRSQLSENPALSPELATAFRNLSTAYNELVLAQISNSSKEDLDEAYRKTDATDHIVVAACK